MQNRLVPGAHGGPMRIAIAGMILVAACGEPAGSRVAVRPDATAPASPSAVATGPRLVSPAEARTLAEWSPGVLIVDVRTAEEYADGHLPGARRVQLDEIGAALDAGAFPVSPDAPVLVYCRAGSRSAQAAALLAGRGFERVYDLEGGIMAWDAAGQPVVR